MSSGFRIRGVSKEVSAFAEARELSITDPTTVEGRILLNGESILTSDVREIWDQLHPLNQQLVAMTGAKSLIAVPLKVKDVVLGSLTVERTTEHALTNEDLELITTLASQVAIALDNTQAYGEIEALKPRPGSPRSRTHGGTGNGQRQAQTDGPPQIAVLGACLS